MVERETKFRRRRARAAATPLQTHRILSPFSRDAAAVCEKAAAVANGVGFPNERRAWRAYFRLAGKSSAKRARNTSDLPPYRQRVMRA